MPTKIISIIIGLVAVGFFIPSLKAVQRNEIQRLQGKMIELKSVNRKILAIAEEHKDKTIEKVLAKSDAEVGLDFLMGKLKLQTTSESPLSLTR